MKWLNWHSNFSSNLQNIDSPTNYTKTAIWEANTYTQVTEIVRAFLKWTTNKLLLTYIFYNGSLALGKEKQLKHKTNVSATV